MSSNATTLLANLKIQIEEVLLDNLNNLEPKSLYEPVSYILKIGGKRIRPLLSLLAAGMTSGNHKDGIAAALAVEYLHNFTLMHDDIMDSADTRRGELTVHTKWDESTAILSGDVMFTMAMQLLMKGTGETDFTIYQLKALCNSFLSATRRVCEGQALDMAFPTKAVVSTDDYMEMITGKTAVLIGASLELGAICANASKEESEDFYQIGLNAGLAFQLQDDLLDLKGDTQKVGKKACGDIYEKKKTWLYLKALELANDSDKAFLTQIFTPKHQITDADVAKVLSILDNLGIYEQCEDIMSVFYTKSTDLLETFEHSVYKEALKELLQFLWKRDH
jgi:geranylgeranyl diphosphate synthase type II